MTWKKQSQEESPRPDASATGHMDVPRTTDGRLLVFLEIIIDKAEDEG